MNTFSLLLSPVSLRNTVYRNRILAAPYGGAKILPGGEMDPENLKFIVSKAAGGCAEVCIGETSVDFKYAHRSPHALFFDWQDLSEKNLQAYRTCAKGIKDNGAVAMIELNHAGHSREPGMSMEVKVSIGPMSFVTIKGVQVLAMDEAMMEDVAENFANCAYFMKQAGFDGVVPHYGHGWLMSQFLSPLTNRRKDRYGGSLENRARFPIMTLRRIRERCGENFLISPRISGEETAQGGMQVEEVALFCQMLEGLVDMVNISVGDYRDPIRSREFSSMYHPHACNAHLSAYIKERVKFPVSTVGGINSPELAEQLLREGKADFVALGRQCLADPAFVNKIIDGRPDEIDRCLRCYHCYPGPMEEAIVFLKGKPPSFRCSINPYADRWTEIAQRPRPKVQRKVLVVGGGFAGMMAAITAAERGHRVTLVEKSRRLGGLLYFSEEDPHKVDIKNYKDSLSLRLLRRGVQVLFGTEVTPEWLKLHPYEAVILAIGSVPACPAIPGLEAARHVLEAYENPVQVGKSVVIAGGGLAGCEAGLFLAEAGRRVTVLEMQEKMAPDSYPMHRVALMIELEKVGVKLMPHTSCLAVTKKGVELAGDEGKSVTLPADTVLYALGMQSRPVASLKAIVGSIPVFTVGDCVAPRKIIEAVEEGFDAGMAVL
jgi:2,4-dienoyl-CoA reductase-like NADH-dependent reductase (Old Yellow Enzyme family)/thioredoxin reductase